MKKVKQSLSLVLVVMLTFLMLACGSVTSGEVPQDIKEEEQQGENVEEQQPVEEEKEEVNYKKVLDEGFTYEADGYSLSVSWCENDGAKVFGRMYYPADFDESQQYITVVMCHGHAGTADSLDSYYAPALAKNGCVCYAIDCRSASTHGRSDDTESGEATVSTYASDILAAVDYVKTKSFVDTNNIYLFGGSMGGMAIQAAASQRPDDIGGLIVLYGAAGGSAATLMDCYEETKANPYNRKEVLFVQGSEDTSSTEANLESNREWYAESSAFILEGAKHGYGAKEDEYSTRTIELACEYIERTKEVE